VSVFVDVPLLLTQGIIASASAVLCRASYNIRDCAIAEEYASLHCRSLLALAKADFEGAVHILAAITARRRITRFVHESVLAVGQLALLLSANGQLLESWRSKSRLL
jgi:hypothetical protein